MPVETILLIDASGEVTVAFVHYLLYIGANLLVVSLDVCTF